MWLRSLSIQSAFCALIGLSFFPTSAEAGPLLDWLFGGRSAPAYPVGAPVPVGNGQIANYGSGYAANYGTYYGPQLPAVGPAGAGYTYRNPTGIAATTLPPTASYVPNYRTNAYRAPVTYYRPMMTTDPNTGAQVVAMAPCTSYEYQTQRVPTFGRSALYGSNSLPSVRPAAPALPTYTLPSGGIPLATTQSPYVTGYRGYTTYQPAAPAQTYGPSGTYQTAPLGAQPYYGAASGGCSNYAAPNSYASPNSYVAPTPGLVAPPGPARTITPAPSYGQVVPGPGGVYPPAGSAYPATPGGVPGAAAPSSDPAADVTPSLPPVSSNRRPQLKSIVRDPPTNFKMVPVEEAERRTVPTMSPIPTPDGYEPNHRWNPGLLKEDDMTALRPIQPKMASGVQPGQSKKIHWASFEESRASVKPVVPATNLRPIRQPTAQYQAQNQAQPLTQTSRQTLSHGTPGKTNKKRYQYDSSGWKSVRN